MHNEINDVIMQLPDLQVTRRICTARRLGDADQAAHSLAEREILDLYCSASGMMPAQSAYQCRGTSNDFREL